MISLTKKEFLWTIFLMQRFMHIQLGLKERQTTMLSQLWVMLWHGLTEKTGLIDLNCKVNSKLNMVMILVYQKLGMSYMICVLSSRAEKLMVKFDMELLSILNVVQKVSQWVLLPLCMLGVWNMIILISHTKWKGISMHLML